MDERDYDSLIDLSLVLKNKTWFHELVEQKKKYIENKKYKKNIYNNQNFLHFLDVIQMYQLGFYAGYKKAFDELRTKIYLMYGIDISINGF